MPIIGCARSRVELRTIAVVMLIILAATIEQHGGSKSDPVSALNVSQFEVLLLQWASFLVLLIAAPCEASDNREYDNRNQP